MAGNIGLAFGLPIAPFTIVDVPAELVEMLPIDQQELGTGPAFGSLALSHALEVSWPQVGSVPIETRSDILVFDWWVRNGDRSLTALGGNPNLLWNPTTERVVVIDQNQAFDDAFNPAEFFFSHIFRAEWGRIVADCVTVATYEQRLEAAIAQFTVACDSCPEEWWWVDEGVPTTFDADKILSQLTAFSQADGFWGGAK
ncbi:hypothetical protein CF68_33185 [Cupriavidus sp. SK-4]|nr:hypothetical protein CF68_33185 [Cupriavidus sp. SK-4]